MKSKPTAAKAKLLLNYAKSHKTALFLYISKSFPIIHLGKYLDFVIRRRNQTADGDHRDKTPLTCHIPCPSYEEDNGSK